MSCVCHVMSCRVVAARRTQGGGVTIQSGTQRRGRPRGPRGKHKIIGEINLYLSILCTAVHQAAVHTLVSPILMWCVLSRHISRFFRVFRFASGLQHPFVSSWTVYVYRRRIFPQFLVTFVAEASQEQSHCFPRLSLPPPPSSAKKGVGRQHDTRRYVVSPKLSVRSSEKRCKKSGSTLRRRRSGSMFRRKLSPFLRGRAPTFRRNV